MLAVKATYDNGAVRWLQKPKVGGKHSVLVVFENVDDTLVSDDAQAVSNVSIREQAIENLQRMYRDIPRDVSLVEELIAERRREAAND